jgi:hypothetical protein
VFDVTCVCLAHQTLALPRPAWRDHVDVPSRLRADIAS